MTDYESAKRQQGVGVTKLMIVERRHVYRNNKNHKSYQESAVQELNYHCAYDRLRKRQMVK